MTEWQVKTDNNRCGNRVVMIKGWRYPYCCIITEGTTPIRHTPCNSERCPLRIREEGAP